MLDILMFAARVSFVNISRLYNIFRPPRGLKGGGRDALVLYHIIHIYRQEISIPHMEHEVSRERCCVWPPILAHISLRWIHVQSNLTREHTTNLSFWERIEN